MTERRRAADATQGAFLATQWFAKERSASTMLIVVPTVEVAEQFEDAVRLFLGAEEESEARVECLLPWDVLPFDVVSPSIEIVARRLAALSALRSPGRAVVITTPEALLRRVLPAETIAGAELSLSAERASSHAELVAALDALGYVRTTLVEDVGQFAVRGAVIDLFPPATRNPLRVEFFGDLVESLRFFDAGTQRTLSTISQYSILPVRELILGRSGEPLPRALTRLRERASLLGVPHRLVAALEEGIVQGVQLPGLEHLAPFFHPKLAAPLESLGDGIRIVLFDEPSTAAAADDFVQLLGERARRAQEEGRLFPPVDDAFVPLDSIERVVLREPHLALDRLTLVGTADSAIEERSDIGVYSLDGLLAALRAARYREHPFSPLQKEILERSAAGYSVAILVSHEAREARVVELLAGYSLRVLHYPGSLRSFLLAPEPNRPGSVWLVRGDLVDGIRSLDPRVVLIPERAIFPELSVRRDPQPSRTVRRFLGSVTQLREDDFVVHVDHGIGIYRGLKQLAVDGKLGDFLHIEYAEEVKLFLPVDQMGKIQKYAGAEGKRPTLSRLGGKQWSQTKAKVKESVAELAGQLVTLLAERELSPGVPMGPIDASDQLFADSFPYEETPDQHRAIHDVLDDLGKSRPMDRLVCGDVGYGKTEVALRAAFKAAHAGKQVAVLVPTTILADQHYQTFAARFEHTGLRVGCVSRFQSTSENRATLEALAAGRVDVIIGTHRVLQRDVIFRDLGLVIIDEEHRFGVAHKERLKRLRKDVHVLTLTATPIPRTLHLSLVGIRDLSIIETPPVNRQVIRTYVAPYREELVREAILRELGRSGQVFYISNRVQNIAAVADEIRDLVPEAKVVYGHGQMKESELEVVMHQFVTGEANVLVSTTIVESGLDIPNANTIIIRNADMFGLAELYQLRGRVGRSSRRAYAYLLIPDPRTLGPDAKKRLEVLQSLDDLGIGFRLAIQDMEIRGAGNLLGKDQSGHIELVGFELYSRILRDAVEELRTRGGKIEGRGVLRPDVDPEIKIGFPAYIPPWYVPDVAERVLLYQRLIELCDAVEGELMFDEIRDRFGHAPEEVEVLIELMVFRGLLRRAGVVGALYREERLTLTFHPELLPDAERVLELVRTSDGQVRVSPKMALTVQVAQAGIRSPLDMMRVVEPLLEELGVFSVSARKAQ